uniref:Protein lifeguard 2 n=1 Tax=Kryptolebias marmoratus TaxID=37003 RepID=A0A3Q3GZH3_KRYMA
PPPYKEATAGTSTRCSTLSLLLDFTAEFDRFYCVLKWCPSGVSTPCYGVVEVLAEFTWDDRNIRRVFIRKVYSILLIQLLVTVAIVALFTFCDPVKDYIQANPGWEITSNSETQHVSYSCRRRFPWNMILLENIRFGLFLLSISYCNTRSVVMCLGITTAVCVVVTVFSFQTKFDVTSCHSVLFNFCIVVLISGLVMSFVLPFQYVPWLHAIFAVLGAILFTMFLAFDTQLLMGKKRYAVSPEDYVFATLSIYLDALYVFTFLLQIFRCGQDSA